MICMSVINLINLILFPPAIQNSSDLSEVDSTPLGESSIFQTRLHIPWDKGGGKPGLFHHMNDN